jgi:hypothetical protein
MNASTHKVAVRNGLTSYFWSDEVLRARNVSDVVLTNKLCIPEPPVWLCADWIRETTTRLDLAAGDVEPLTLSRARTRWPGYRTCLQSVSGWMHTLGFSQAYARGDIALMVCHGARYHQDATQYGSKAFCNLFLSEDKGLDLHFPHTGDRIPLERGTVVLFDTAQPHGVVKRGSSGFDLADFTALQDELQVFLSWELSIEDAELCRVLGIRIDDMPSNIRAPQDEQVWNNGALATVCPESGQWLDIDGVISASAC